MSNSMPLTKDVIEDIMKDMQLMGGDLPSECVRKAYVVRLNGLLKHGALQVLDHPQRFESTMEMKRRPPNSNLSFLKAILQFIQTLKRKGRWYEFYQQDAETTLAAYRQLIRQMNLQLKEMQAASPPTEGCV